MIALQQTKEAAKWQPPKTYVLRFPSPSTSESAKNENLGQTTSEYIANLIQDYYNMMENQKGGIQMTEKGRTMAFQIPEELFQRIKRHLERETLRSGKKLTQRDFVLNLITQALDEADTENATEQNTPTEAPVAPRVADVTAPADTDTPDEDTHGPWG